MEFKVIQIPPSEIPNVWTGVQSWLEAAIWHGNGELLTEDLYVCCLQSRMQLWISVNADYVPHGALVTEVITYPRKRVVRIVALGGKSFKEWLPALEKTGDEWARKVGATAIEAMGRKGWLRFLRGTRFKEKYCFMIKEVQSRMKQ
jgi:hypothetical protein